MGIVLVFPQIEPCYRHVRLSSPLPARQATVPEPTRAQDLSRPSRPEPTQTRPVPKRPPAPPTRPDPTKPNLSQHPNPAPMVPLTVEKATGKSFWQQPWFWVMVAVAAVLAWNRSLIFDLLSGSVSR